MLSIYAIPKSFCGQTGVIQRNAIRSWTMLRPACQVILVGNEDGTNEVAEEFGIDHAPNVGVDDHGTPREDSVLQLAEQSAKHPLMCSVASDVILMSDFMQAVERLQRHGQGFAMCGQRWNLKVTEPVDFDSPWENDIHELLSRRGRLFVRTGMDYMVFPRGLFKQVPPFSVGRGYYDSWLLYAVRSLGTNLVDVTRVVKAVHQDHDYSHHGPMAIDQIRRNAQLAGNRRYHFNIKDRTHVLTNKGLKRPRDLWRYWRLLRTIQALHPTLPAPLLWLGERVNRLIDVTRECYQYIYLHLGISRPHHRSTGK